MGIKKFRAFSGFVLLILFTAGLHAQTLISPLSGFKQNGDISLAFSLGEVVSGDFESESFLFTAGFSGINGGILISNEPEGNDLPDQLKLDQNYPNPFNPSTNIEFSLPKQADVRLEIFNSIGMRVATLINQNKTAGYHMVRFDASSYSSGMYFYRLVVDGNIVSTKKMILIK